MHLTRRSLPACSDTAGLLPSLGTLMPGPAVAQTISVKDGVMLGGYDPVGYFAA